MAPAQSPAAARALPLVAYGLLGLAAAAALFVARPVAPGAEVGVQVSEQTRIETHIVSAVRTLDATRLAGVYRAGDARLILAVDGTWAAFGAAVGGATSGRWSVAGPMLTLGVVTIAPDSDDVLRLHGTTWVAVADGGSR